MCVCVRVFVCVCVWGMRQQGSVNPSRVRVTPLWKLCHPVVVGHKRPNDCDVMERHRAAARIAHILLLFCQPDILVGIL